MSDETTPAALALLKVPGRAQHMADLISEASTPGGGSRESDGADSAGSSASSKSTPSPQSQLVFRRVRLQYTAVSEQVAHHPADLAHPTSLWPGRRAFIKLALTLTLTLTPDPGLALACRWP